MKYNVSGMEIHVSKGVMAFIISFLLVAAGISGVLISRSHNRVVFDIPMEETTTTGNELSISKNLQDETDSNMDGNKQEKDAIKVYVVGCVKTPGIVTLKKGQLIDDAVKAAGGVTEEADIDNINLVYELDDNVMLKIRSKKENQEAAGAVKDIKITGRTDNKNSEAGKGVIIIRDNGGAVIGDTGAENKLLKGEININTATMDELDTLPYIGKETAKDIISYRQKSGPFKSIRDIMKVPGIKGSRFNKIRDYITVD